MKGMIKKSLIGILAGVLFAGIAFAGNVHAKGVYHNVTYIYGMKSVTVPVRHGANAPVPTDTYVPGYTFAYWTASAANVTEDRVILGAYVKDAPVQPAPVVQPIQTVQSYSLKVSPAKSANWPEWWSTMNIPKGIPGKTCAVHWYNKWTGELWKTDIVPYGSSLPNPPDPCLEGYDFAGWEGDWTNITEDRAIGACYFVKHKLVFKDSIDDSTIDVVWVRDGEGAYPDAPWHKNKKFDGYYWSGGGEYDGEGVHSDHTLYAKYKDE